jgi:glycosyltransferase involved in cell wall biosynthesis
MNILLTLHHHLDPNAGAAGATCQLGQHYQSFGHDVQYYSFDDLPQRLPEIAKIVTFPEFVLNHLREIVPRQKLDVITASTGDTWLWGQLCQSTKKHRPLLVTQSHGLEQIAHLECLKEAHQKQLKLSWKYPLYHGGMRLWEVARSLRYSDLVFMLNQRDAEYTTQHLGVASKKIHILPNGIPSYFLNLPVDLANETLTAPVTIVQVGSYIPRKGMHYSTPALIEVLSRHSEVHVRFLGTGCSSDQIYANFPEPLHSQIEVIPSYEHHNLPNLLQGCHILLFPSLSEGFPLAIPEAMACGLVPIATDIPGPTEIVIHEHNGLLVPTRNSLAIAEALEKLILNSPDRHRLRQNAYRTAQKYGWQTIAKRRLEIYQTALVHREVTL